MLAHAWQAEFGLAEELGAEAFEADFADPAAPAAVVDRAVATFGRVDALVANHARSSDVPLESLTAEELDLTWAVNARATVLLVKAFAQRATVGARVVLLTSGQHLRPMPREIPYAISKGAVHQMTLTLSEALAPHGMTVNAVNPGPVDTGWASDELRDRLAPRFPGGRWGRPEDIAPVVAWLASEDSGWITGQVLNAEGGFRGD